MRNLTILFLLLSLQGCQIMDRRLILDPCKDQVLRVQSGDRLYFSLPDDGGVWEYECDDDDVEVAIHPTESGISKFSLRVHRGYDGPTSVIFRCRQLSNGQIMKSFALGLYRGTGDFAAWK